MARQNGVSCECFYGTAYFDKQGNCLCDNGITGKPDYDPTVYTKPAVMPTTVRGGNGTRLKPRYDINGRRIPVSTDMIRCRARQAPSGYHYGMLNGVCVLMTADGKPVQTVAASQTGADDNTVTATAGQTLTANLQALVSQNPLLVLAAVGGIGYLLLKKK